MRRRDRVRKLLGWGDVRRRRPEPLRHERLPAKDLCANGRLLRDRLRHVLANHRLRHLPRAADLRRRRHAERVRLHSQDLRAARCELRLDSGRLRKDVGLRGVPRGAVLRRWRTEPVRHRQLRRQDVRAAQRGLRAHFRRLLEDHRLWQVQCPGDMRRKRRGERVWLRAQDLRPARCKLRHGAERLRVRDRLRRLSERRNVRRSRSAQPVRVRLLAPPCNRRMPGRCVRHHRLRRWLGRLRSTPGQRLRGESHRRPQLRGVRQDL